jgi:hypothetical protein
MAQDTLSLWPASIRPSIKSPATILAAQAKELSLQTDGVLLGEFKTSVSADGKQIIHALDMYAPALNYRHRVLTAYHEPGLVYPVCVESTALKPRLSMIWHTTQGPRAQEAEFPSRKTENEAASDQELVELVKRVLNAPEVVGVAISLIARVEEVREQSKQSANSGTPNGEGDK